jgi:hypothetical protein
VGGNSLPRKNILGGAALSMKAYSVQAEIAFPWKSILEGISMTQEGLRVGISLPGKNILRGGNMKHEDLFYKSRNCITWEEHSGKRHHEAQRPTLYER